MYSTHPIGTTPPNTLCAFRRIYTYLLISPGQSTTKNTKKKNVSPTLCRCEGRGDILHGAAQEPTKMKKNKDLLGGFLLLGFSVRSGGIEPPTN